MLFTNWNRSQASGATHAAWVYQEMFQIRGDRRIKIHAYFRYQEHWEGKERHLLLKMP